MLDGVCVWVSVSLDFGGVLKLICPCGVWNSYNRVLCNSTETQ